MKYHIIRIIVSYNDSITHILEISCIITKQQDYEMYWVSCWSWTPGVNELIITMISLWYNRGQTRWKGISIAVAAGSRRILFLSYMLYTMSNGLFHVQFAYLWQSRHSSPYPLFSSPFFPSLIASLPMAIHQYHLHSPISILFWCY